MRINYFISYSHQDKDLFEKIVSGIQEYKSDFRNRTSVIWTDVNIETGSNWRTAILNAMNTCNIALLLVSPSFLKSRYVRFHELPFFIKKIEAEEPGFKIFPIVLRVIDKGSLKKLKDLQFFTPKRKDFFIEELDLFPYAKLFNRNADNVLFAPDATLVDLYHLELAKELEKQAKKIKEILVKQNNPKHSKTLSNHAIKKYNEYGIELGLLHEHKMTLTENIQVSYFEHELIVKGKDLIQKITLKGTNLSTKEINYIPFLAGANIPSSKEQMKIKCFDISKKKTLKYSCPEEEDTLVKKIKLQFSKPLLPGQHFEVYCGFTEKNTMRLKGKDFLISTLCFKEMVNEYKMIVKFADSAPEFVIVEELSSKAKSKEMLPEKNGKFSIGYTNRSIPNLNRLRLLLRFERK